MHRHFGTNSVLAGALAANSTGFGPGRMLDKTERTGIAETVLLRNRRKTRHAGKLSDQTGCFPTVSDDFHVNVLTRRVFKTPRA